MGRALLSDLNVYNDDKEVKVMNNKTSKIKSRLRTRGTAKIQADVKKDLRISDPEPGKAKAILDEAIENEEDLEETDGRSDTDHPEDSED